jgi:hypothetical protein
VADLVRGLRALLPDSPVPAEAVGKPARVVTDPSFGEPVTDFGVEAPDLGRAGVEAPDLGRGLGLSVGLRSSSSELSSLSAMLSLRTAFRGPGERGIRRRGSELVSWERRRLGIGKTAPFWRMEVRVSRVSGSYFSQILFLNFCFSAKILPKKNCEKISEKDFAGNKKLTSQSALKFRFARFLFGLIFREF